MDDLLVRLSRLDSCAVSDALDKLGLTGAVSGMHRLSTDRRIAGRVVTVKLEPHEGRPAGVRHLGTAAIELAQPGDVIVVEQRTGIDAAAWGGNLALGAKIRGVAGVIVEGPARDVDECHAISPCSPVPHRAHRRNRIVQPAAVHHGGRRLVSPGDYVVADGARSCCGRAEVEHVLGRRKTSRRSDGHGRSLLQA